MMKETQVTAFPCYSYETVKKASVSPRLACCNGDVCCIGRLTGCLVPDPQDRVTNPTSRNIH